MGEMEKVYPAPGSQVLLIESNIGLVAIDSGGEIEAGDKVILFETGDGKFYARKSTEVEVGDQVLLYLNTDNSLSNKNALITGEGENKVMCGKKIWGKVLGGLGSGIGSLSATANLIGTSNSKMSGEGNECVAGSVYGDYKINPGIVWCFNMGVAPWEGHAPITHYRLSIERYVGHLYIWVGTYDDDGTGLGQKFTLVHHSHEEAENDLCPDGCILDNLGGSMSFEMGWDKPVALASCLTDNGSLPSEFRLNEEGTVPYQHPLTGVVGLYNLDYEALYIDGHTE